MNQLYSCNKPPLLLSEDRTVLHTQRCGAASINTLRRCRIAFTGSSRAVRPTRVPSEFNDPATAASYSAAFWNAQMPWERGTRYPVVLVVMSSGMCTWEFRPSPLPGSLGTREPLLAHAQPRLRLASAVTHAPTVPARCRWHDFPQLSVLSDQPVCALVG